uniref:Histone H2B.3-like n=1 Tax=Caenorhabditis tropicalis TaxID=1561998 RepID=A0A1I7TSN6_9PELO
MGRKKQRKSVRKEAKESQSVPDATVASKAVSDVLQDSINILAELVGNKMALVQHIKETAKEMDIEIVEEMNGSETRFVCRGKVKPVEAEKKEEVKKPATRDVGTQKPYFTWRQRYHCPYLN